MFLLYLGITVNFLAKQNLQGAFFNLCNNNCDQWKRGCYLAGGKKISEAPLNTNFRFQNNPVKKEYLRIKTK